MPSSRSVFFVSFLLSCLILATAAYLQWVVNLAPCPLCTLQRGLFFAIAILLLLASLRTWRAVGRRIFSSLLFIFALFNSLISGRHLWLQSQPPDELASCGADLAYLFDILPWQAFLQLLFSGSAECTTVQWRLLGLSIPAWALVCSLIFAGIAIWQFIRKS
jgi:disulfide bond formation protein DsbB